MTSTATIEALAVPKLTISRTFAAARARVFKAFTDPDVLKEWFGPEGFSVPSATVDFRVGGKYRITMRSPEETDHTVIGIYREIDEPNRLVFTWAWETGDMPDADTLVMQWTAPTRRHRDVPKCGCHQPRGNRSRP